MADADEKETRLFFPSTIGFVTYSRPRAQFSAGAAKCCVVQRAITKVTSGTRFYSDDYATYDVTYMYGEISSNKVSWNSRPFLRGFSLRIFAHSRISVEAIKGIGYLFQKLISFEQFLNLDSPIIAIFRDLLLRSLGKKLVEGNKTSFTPAR